MQAGSIKNFGQKITGVLEAIWKTTFVFEFQKQPTEMFQKFTRKHLRQSLFLNIVPALSHEAWNFIKKEILAQVFSREFCKIFNNAYFEEHLRTTASGVLKIEVLNLQVRLLVVPLANLLLYILYQLIKIKLMQSRNNEHFVKLMVECRVLHTRGLYKKNRWSSLWYQRWIQSP